MIEEAESAAAAGQHAWGRSAGIRLEARLQSAHVYRRRTGEANWAAVVQLYDALSAITGSPVVAINRALAIAEIEGAAAALEAMPEAARRCAAGRIPTLLGGARGVTGEGRGPAAARRAYEIAIGLERDPAVRRFLQGRQAALSE